MERMEIDQCASAAVATGGGALRRSNSAPMITGVSSDGMAVFSSTGSTRCRRSSMSVKPSCPGPVSAPVFSTTPLSPFPVSSERPYPHRQEESMELSLWSSVRQSGHLLPPLPPVTHWHDHLPLGIHPLDSSVTPNSSPSPTRRFKNRAALSAVRWPVLTSLKRKGGAESDAPPKKLFVAGVTDPSYLAGCAVSVSHPVSCPQANVPPCVTTHGSPVSRSPPSCTASHPGL